MVIRATKRDRMPSEGSSVRDTQTTPAGKRNVYESSTGSSGDFKRERDRARLFERGKPVQEVLGADTVRRMQ